MSEKYQFVAEKAGKLYKKSDSAFVVMTFLLWGIGIVTLYFTSSGYAQRAFSNPFYFVKKQLASSAVGAVLMLFMAFADVKFIRKCIPAFVGFSLLLCLLTFVPSINVTKNGAARWIRVPYFATFQPSEFAKFSVVLFLANFFDKQERLPPDERNVLGALLGLAIFTAVIFAQSDFSTGFFLFLVGLIMFFVTNARLSWFVPVALLGLPLVSLLILLKPYRVSRLVAFLAQDKYQQTLNYQLTRAKSAISNGGFFGQGLGTGLTKIRSVPEIQSDYIFAGFSEGMGLLGVLIYLLMLGFFTYRILKISLTCSDRFASVASFGFGMSIVIQSLVNIAVVCGVLPATGIPLPFFSSGGSSMIFTLGMCGFVMNASKIEKFSVNESEFLFR